MLSRFELFIISVARIYKSIQKIKSREMTELGLKGPQVMCLLNLRRSGELTSAELSSLCMEDKGGISRTISKLESEGLVYLDAPGDKRRYRAKIKLTPKGQELSDKMVTLIESSVSRAGEGLTEEERAVFYKALGIIADNLQNICENKGETK